MTNLPMWKMTTSGSTLLRVSQLKLTTTFQTRLWLIPLMTPMHNVKFFVYTFAYLKYFDSTQFTSQNQILSLRNKNFFNLGKICYQIYPFFLGLQPKVQLPRSPNPKMHPPHAKFVGMQRLKISPKPPNFWRAWMSKILVGLIQSIPGE